MGGLGVCGVGAGAAVWVAGLALQCIEWGGWVGNERLQ